ncbi:ABC transporter permease [Enterocloster sp.]|uniref:ABC transporter permease n=1 Tax=Enterocloster sp. TaxID=2719315 RepID=UPI003994BDCE
MIPLAILAGALAGLLYAVLPALLKIRFQIDEMITTLMLNYAAIQFTEYLTMLFMGLGSDTNPDLIATPEIQTSAQLTRIMPPYQAGTGFFIGLALAAFIFILYRYTRIGYEWKMIGRNRDFARYGGVRHFINYLVIFLLSGAIAGVCGAVEILGPHLRFRTNFSTNLGWDGIMVALIARNSPIGAAVTAVVWGMIKAGSLSMERMTSVNRVLVTLVQALFVLFITLDFKSLFRKKRTVRRREA